MSPQRVLPVLLLAGFSLYGLWFVPTAWSVRSSSARQTAAVQPPPEVEAPERPAAAAPHRRLLAALLVEELGCHRPIVYSTQLDVRHTVAALPFGESGQVVRKREPQEERGEIRA